MKFYFWIIVFCSICGMQASAQLTAFAKSQVYAIKNNTVVLQHLSVQIPTENALKISFKYYKDSLCVDSFTSYCNTTNAEYIGKYWHRTIQHQLPYGKYNCQILITQSTTNQTWFTENEVSLQPITDTTYLLQPTITFVDDNSKQTVPLIGDFCDSNINTLQINTQLFTKSVLDSNLFIYLRITKRGKPNHILYSRVDTIIGANCKQNGLTYKSTIPLSSLGSGNYIAYVSVYRGTVLLKKVETFFQCLRPTASPVTKSIETVDEFSEQLIDIKNSFVAKFDTTVLNRNILSLQAIVTNSQFRVIQQLVEAKNDTIMRRYFYNFWQTKNNANPEAEWRIYAAKLNDCMKKFGGTTNDRAITYLRYGKPDKVEEVPNEVNTIPYEIWQYEAIQDEQNVVFLFIQGRGVDNQKALLHSTLIGEKQYPNWRTLLIKGEDNNNRVLEYLQENGKSK